MDFIYCYRNPFIDKQGESEMKQLKTEDGRLIEPTVEAVKKESRRALRESFPRLEPLFDADTGDIVCLLPVSKRALRELQLHSRYEDWKLRVKYRFRVLCSDDGDCIDWVWTAIDDLNTKALVTGRPTVLTDSEGNLVYQLPLTDEDWLTLMTCGA